MGVRERGGSAGSKKTQEKRRQRTPQSHTYAALFRRKKSFSNGLTQKLLMSKTDKRLRGCLNSKKLRMDIEEKLTVISIK